MQTQQSSSINVYCRLKPSNTSIWQQNNTNTLQCNQNQYLFDQIFPMSSNNYQIYKSTAQQNIQNLLSGSNINILFYGQTASGKTYTMIGKNSLLSQQQQLSIKYIQEAIKQSQFDHIGLIVYTLLDIFKEINKSANETKYTLSISYFEIYNEQVFDLLSANVGQSLPIQEDVYSKEFYVRNLTYSNVVSMEQIISLINQGESNRHFSQTVLNHCSSRSHTLFQIHLTAYQNESVIPQFNSCYTFIDLAGSEKLQLEQEMKRTKECQSINKSLFFLSRVLQLKSQKYQTNHLPYRDSALTKILKSTFEGESYTSIILFIIPIEKQLEQSQQTIKFGMCSKQIKKPVISTNKNYESSKTAMNNEEKEIILARLKNILKNKQASLQCDTVYIESTGLLFSKHKKPNQDQRQQLDQIQTLLFDYEGKFYQEQYQKLLQNTRKQQSILEVMKCDKDLLQEQLRRQSQKMQQSICFEDMTSISNDELDKLENKVTNFLELIKKEKYKRCALKKDLFDSKSLKQEIQKLIEESQGSRQIDIIPTTSGHVRLQDLSTTNNNSILKNIVNTQHTRVPCTTKRYNKSDKIDKTDKFRQRFHSFSQSKRMSQSNNNKIYYLNMSLSKPEIETEQLNFVDQ